MGFTFTDWLTALSWAIVACGSTAGVLHRSCRTVTECVALGLIALCAAARAWSVFTHEYVQPPDLLLSGAAAVYVAVHIHKALHEKKSNKEWEKKMPGGSNENKLDHS